MAQHQGDLAMCAPSSAPNPYIHFPHLSQKLRLRRAAAVPPKHSIWDLLFATLEHGRPPTESSLVSQLTHRVEQRPDRLQPSMPNSNLGVIAFRSAVRYGLVLYSTDPLLVFTIVFVCGETATVFFLGVG